LLQLCGIQIAINNAAVYSDTNNVTIKQNSSYSLDLTTLQQNILWTETNQICNPPAQFSTADIQQLVIGKIGDYIASNQYLLDWQRSNETTVSVSLNETTQVSNKLQYTWENRTIPFTLVKLTKHKQVTNVHNKLTFVIRSSLILSSLVQTIS